RSRRTTRSTPASASASCSSSSCSSRRRASRGSSSGRKMLRLERVSKHFGGVVATDAVTLEVRAGEIHALIGPNGAGKTTLIGQISGSVEVDGGEILFEDRKVTRIKQ